MSAIAFESAASTLSLRNPFNGFNVEEHRVEVRRDPLLGDSSVLNRYQQNKTGFSGENDREFIARLVEKAPRPASSAASGSAPGPRATRTTSSRAGI